MCLRVLWGMGLLTLYLLLSRFRIAELDRATRYLRGSRLQEGAKQPEFVKQLLELAGLHKEEGDYSVRLAHMYVVFPASWFILCVYWLTLTDCV